ncbi:unnamed protein product [Phaeothamnion confervicola]
MKAPAQTTTLEVKKWTIPIFWVFPSWRAMALQSERRRLTLSLWKRQRKLRQACPPAKASQQDERAFIRLNCRCHCAEASPLVHSAGAWRARKWGPDSFTATSVRRSDC